MSRGTVHRYQLVLLILFLGFIALPMASDLFNTSHNLVISKNENRRLASRPVLHGLAVDTFTRAYERYYNDHFFCRAGLMKFNTLVTGYYLFHRSPVPDIVAFGSNGWLYSTGKEREVYEGRMKVTRPYLEAMSNELRNRAKRYQAMGIRFYVTIVPMKSVIYPEYLPDWYLASGEPTFTEQVSDLWRHDTLFRFIDLKKHLLDARKEGMLYYRTDNHWNGSGAWEAYSAIMCSICLDFPGMQPLPRHRIDLSPDHYAAGDLARIAGLEDYLAELIFNPKVINPTAMEAEKSGYPPPKLFGYPSQYELVRQTPDTTLPKIVVIRDSFFSPMVDLFAEHFSKSVYLFDCWHYGANYRIIEQEKPDVVLLQIYEPHLSNVLFRME